VGAKRVRVYRRGVLLADTITPRLVWEHDRYPAYYLPAADVRMDALEAVDPVAWRRADEDLIRFEFGRFDWFEEDEPIAVHPRDPYKRVDILASSRHVEVVVDEVTVADSVRPSILFETSLPPRYYLRRTDVRMDLLTPSASQTQCPYKGTATYWSLGAEKDIVWTYVAPLLESVKIAGLVCFYNERVDLIVDGVLQERPATAFSPRRGPSAP
jgi:uncharacterized protein (DUF427 family)